MQTSTPPLKLGRQPTLQGRDWTENIRQAMRDAGIDTDAHLVADGRLHRFHVEGDKTESRNGWYVLFDGEVPAGAFGCWRRGISGTWSQKNRNQMNPSERKKLTWRLNEAKQLREAEAAKVHAEARERARDTWEKASDVTSHPYLKNKGVGAHGIRANGGSLVISVKNIEGALQSLQFIGPDGSKKFLSGGRVKGGHHIIGEPNGKIFIVEGYATAATIYETMGAAAVVAFNSGNLPAVAEAIHQKFPDTDIIIAADNDTQTDRNPGLAKAQEAALAVGGKVAVPEFKNTSSNPTDFNDLNQLEGAEKVRELLAEANEPSLPLSVVLGKLAALSPIEYDQCRKAEAKRLDIREVTLDAEVEKLRKKSAAQDGENGQQAMFEKVEPWPEPVNGTDLLSDLTSILTRHCILPEGAAAVVALWIMHSYVYDAFDFSPILAIMSPEKRCGKTTLMRILLHLVYKPLQGSSIKTAVLFRAIVMCTGKSGHEILLNGESKHGKKTRGKKTL